MARSPVKPQADEWTLEEYSTRDLVGRIAGDGWRQVQEQAGSRFAQKAERRALTVLQLQPTQVHLCRCSSLRLNHDKLEVVRVWVIPSASFIQSACAQSWSPNLSLTSLPSPTCPVLAGLDAQLIPFFVIGETIAPSKLSQVSRPGADSQTPSTPSALGLVVRSAPQYLAPRRSSRISTSHHAVQARRATRDRRKPRPELL